MGKKPSKIEKIAYHEAGHAVACHLLWRAFTRVSIIPDDDSLSRVEYPKIRVKGLDFENLDEDPVERFLIREKLEKRLERRKE
jgi:ATP-dependent Zn protease